MSSLAHCCFFASISFGEGGKRLKPFLMLLSAIFRIFWGSVSVIFTLANMRQARSRELAAMVQCPECLHGLYMLAERVRSCLSGG